MWLLNMGAPKRGGNVAPGPLFPALRLIVIGPIFRSGLQQRFACVCTNPSMYAQVYWTPVAHKSASRAMQTSVDYEVAGPAARTCDVAAHEGEIIQRSDSVLFQDFIQFYWTARSPTLGGHDVAQVTGSMEQS